MNEKLEEIEILIQGKRYREALAQLQSIEKEMVIIEEKAFYNNMMGTTYMMLCSCEAVKYFDNACRKYWILNDQVGIQDSWLMIRWQQCLMDRAQLHYECGEFGTADELSDRVCIFIEGYRFDGIEEYDALRLRLKGKILRMMIHDKKEEYGKAESYISEIRHIMGKLEEEGIKPSNDACMLEALVSIFGHYLSMSNWRAVWNMMSDLKKSAESLFKYSDYSEDSGRAFSLMSKAFMKDGNFNLAEDAAENAVQMILCMIDDSGVINEKSRPSLAEAYMLKGRAYMMRLKRRGIFRKSEACIKKSVEIAKKLYDEHAERFMELYAECSLYMALLYYYGKAKDEPAHKAVRHIINAVNLYRKMYESRDRSAYWRTYMYALLVMSEIYEGINENTVEWADKERNLLLERNINDIAVQ